MEKVPGVSYHETLSSASEDLESLGHNLAFEHLLHDNAVENSAYASFAEGTTVEMHATWLPEDFVREQFLPPVFTLSELHVQLTEQVENKEISQSSLWNLNMSYKVNDRPYVLVSTESQTTITTTNWDGAPLTYIFPAATGGKVLLGALNCSLDKKIPELGKGLPDEAFTSTQAISNAIGILGRLTGKSTKTVAALLRNAEVPDRTLIAVMKETETQRVSGMNIDFFLSSEFIPDKQTAIRSSQNETMRGATLFNRYGKRHPHDIPDDLLYQALQVGMLDEPADEIFINPNLQREQYDLLSTAIMSVIRPCLQEYKYFDDYNASEYKDDSHVPENP